MMIHKGGCHCGNLSYVFETSTSLDKLGLRMCRCSFCCKHNQRSTSDPAGTIKLSIKDSQKLCRYRFAQKSCDFLICKICGVYIGAAMEDKDGAWMVVNVNTWDEVPALNFPTKLPNFDSENAAARIARRKTVWTPLSYVEVA